MTEYIKIRERTELAERAAVWFHEKWGIPLEAYQESIRDCVSGKAAIPQWYLAMEGDTIAGGLGLIANDFHKRPEITPNICAVYVEEEFRKRGIAGKLLSMVCEDAKSFGINTLYLLTSHDSFYERYGFSYDSMIETDEGTFCRLYAKTTE